MSGLAGLKGVPRKGAPFSLWAVLFLFGLVSGVEAQPCLPFQVDEWAEVSYVYDGDTVRLSDGRKVRLIGINTPEIGHDGQVSEPLGDAARQALQGLLVGQPQVALRYEEDRRDRYGRLLAHLYLLDQRNVQELLLSGGWQQRLRSRLILPIWSAILQRRLVPMARVFGSSVVLVPMSPGVYHVRRVAFI